MHFSLREFDNRYFLYSATQERHMSIYDVHLSNPQSWRQREDNTDDKESGSSYAQWFASCIYCNDTMYWSQTGQHWSMLRCRVGTLKRMICTGRVWEHVGNLNMVYI